MASSSAWTALCAASESRKKEPESYTTRRTSQVNAIHGTCDPLPVFTLTLTRTFTLTHDSAGAPLPRDSHASPAAYL